MLQIEASKAVKIKVFDELSAAVNVEHNIDTKICLKEIYLHPHKFHMTMIFLWKGKCKI